MTFILIETLAEQPLFRRTLESWIGRAMPIRHFEEPKLQNCLNKRVEKPIQSKLTA